MLIRFVEFKNIFRVIFFVGLFVLAYGTVLAGVSNAVISCQSISKKVGAVQLNGEIPVDLPDFELSLKKNKSEIKMTGKADEDIQVIDDFKNRVFTMTVDSDEGRLIMYAIPSSVVIRENNENSVKVRFNAILLQAPEPGSEDFLSNVRMKCSYEYSI
jgi:hypothetical protein